MSPESECYLSVRTDKFQGKSPTNPVSGAWELWISQGMQTLKNLFFFFCGGILLKNFVYQEELLLQQFLNWKILM